MKKMLVLPGILLMLAVIITACGGQAAISNVRSVAPATAAPTSVPIVTGDPLRGAKLYDIWFEELAVDPPTEVNPLWTDNAKAGDTAPEDSYRCAVCHGFDYKGDLGFPGISTDAGKDPNVILAMLKGSTNPKHDFSTLLDDQALSDLALFVSKEQIDVTGIVDADGKPVNGSPDAGKTLFETNCIKCHGKQGLVINFNTDADPEYIGTISSDGTVEFLTKLRFGQPGITKMPANVDNNWKNQDYADLIAYAQTLPQASPVTEGGRMYDNWIDALGATAPTGDQPLWKTQTANTSLSGGDTWLCSNCHGFDYKGADGVNSQGSEGYTGFPGILDARRKSADELTAWLDGTKNPDHNFKDYFNADEMARMVAFMQGDMIDRSTFVDANGKATGDPIHGKVLYTSICKICHGDDGKTINFAAADGGYEYVGTIAVNEPFGLMHKATNGLAGTPMVAGINFGWYPQDIADVLAWAQTLPTK